MKSYLFLLGAIIFETLATSALKSSEQFTKLVPSLLAIVGYILAFYLLSMTLKTIPVGVAYAIWAGVGIVLISIVGIFAFKQIPDLPAILGMILIIAGVLVINLFSKTAVH